MSRKRGPAYVTGPGPRRARVLDADQLSSYVVRLAKIHDEIARLHAEKRRIYREAYVAGFSREGLRECLERLRPAKRRVKDLDTFHVYWDLLKHAVKTIPDPEPEETDEDGETLA